MHSNCNHRRVAKFRRDGTQISGVLHSVAIQQRRHDRFRAFYAAHQRARGLDFPPYLIIVVAKGQQVCGAVIWVVCFAVAGFDRRCDRGGRDGCDGRCWTAVAHHWAGLPRNGPKRRIVAHVVLLVEGAAFVRIYLSFAHCCRCWGWCWCWRRLRCRGRRGLRRRLRRRCSCGRWRDGGDGGGCGGVRAATAQHGAYESELCSHYVDGTVAHPHHTAGANIRWIYLPATSRCGCGGCCSCERGAHALVAKHQAFGSKAGTQCWVLAHGRALLAQNEAVIGVANSVTGANRRFRWRGCGCRGRCCGRCCGGRWSGRWSRSRRW